MNSTGNDIVSLNAIDITRTKQYRFYSKILSTTEKELYRNAKFTAIPFENFVWLLWSIKESAFKYLQRIRPDLIFSPTKFVVKQLHLLSDPIITNFEAKQTEGIGFDGKDSINGMIAFGAYILYSKSLIYNELIVSVVNCDENFENTAWGIKLIDKSDPHCQSMEVRTLLVNKLNSLFSADNISIGKNSNGVPTVMKENKTLPISVSLSHHDRLVAYSFQLAEGRSCDATSIKNLNRGIQIESKR